MAPAFSTLTWTTMSGRAVRTAHVMSGNTKKLRDSGPQRPSRPLSLPMVVSCWQGEPPTMS
eukprot:12271381-Heterocapsa_arctica.AAC.1